VELAFALLSEAAVLPTRAHDGDAGLDLYAAERALLEPGGRASVGTGVAVAIPPAHAGLVLPRSGLAARHGIALVNAPGLIDAGYRGEIRVLLLNTDAREPFGVEVGDRIAQLLVTPFTDAQPISSAELELSARGEKGFGSSGR
jgi:dUTP pyrophosphatase